MTKQKTLSQRKLQFPNAGFFLFLFFMILNNFLSLSHWDITTPFALEIHVIKNDAEECGDHRPA